MCDKLHTLAGRCQLPGERDHRVVPPGVLGPAGGPLHISRDWKDLGPAAGGVVAVTHEWVFGAPDMTSTWHFDGPPDRLGGVVSDILDRLDADEN